jgi:O-antigen/teichoic acid export membrane protein
MTFAVSLRAKLFADGLYTFAFRIVTMLLAAALGIVTARALGPTGRGVYALPMVSAALVTASYAGLNTATSYFMLRRGAGTSVIRPALATVMLFVAIGIPAVMLLARAEHAQWSALPAILTLPAPALLFVLYGYQVGTNRVRANSTFAMLNSALLLTLMLVALSAFGHLPRTAVAAWVAASDLFALVALVWMLRDARTLAGRPVRLREFAAYAARVGAVSLVSLLNYRADVYVVAVFGGPRLLGMYTLAVTIAEMLLMPTQVTAVVSSPHIGGMESSRAAADLAARCVRNNVLVAFATCAVLWAIAPVAVRTLYGATFLPMIPAFRMLLAGVFALSLGSPMSTYFTIRQGRPQLPLALAGLSATICIAVSVATVKQYGMLGAAFGSTLGYVVGQGAAIFFFTRMSGVSPSSMLLPRWSDVTAYAAASGDLLRRVRRAIASSAQ